MDWWINKLTDSSVSTSIAYAGGHALPTGAAAPAQTIDTQYAWNDDRTPSTKTVQSGVDGQESTTTYAYPTPPATSYGLPTQVQISGPSVSPSRSTSYTYTKDGTSAATDGYFVYTTTNALMRAPAPATDAERDTLLASLDAEAENDAEPA